MNGVYEERAFFKQFIKDVDELIEDAEAENRDILSLYNHTGQTFVGEVRAVLRKYADFDPEHAARCPDTPYLLEFSINIKNQACSSYTFGVPIFDVNGVLRGQLGNTFEDELESMMGLIGEDSDYWLALIEENYEDSSLID